MAGLEILKISSVCVFYFCKVDNREQVLFGQFSINFSIYEFFVLRFLLIDLNCDY